MLLPLSSQDLRAREMAQWLSAPAANQRTSVPSPRPSTKYKVKTAWYFIIYYFAIQKVTFIPGILILKSL